MIKTSPLSENLKGFLCFSYIFILVNKRSVTFVLQVNVDPLTYLLSPICGSVLLI